MIISNFRPEEPKKKKVIIAEVDVTTGILWWKKTEQAKIGKLDEANYWFFVETGAIILECDVANAMRVWRAK